MTIAERQYSPRAPLQETRNLPNATHQIIPKQHKFQITVEQPLHENTLLANYCPTKLKIDGDIIRFTIEES